MSYFIPRDKSERPMQRVTVTLDDELVAEIDRLVEKRGYQNRSEALRDLARAGMREARPVGGDGARECVGALVYVYDHHARQLSQRLTDSYHDHHDLSLSSLHVHLDHQSCLEVTVLRGREKDVRHLADHVIAERGVRHGRLMTIPVTLEEHRHDHGEGSHRHVHTRVREAG